MGKRRIAGAVLVLCLIMLFHGTVVYGAEGTCEIEQISLRMPEVRMYYRAQEPENSYEAYLGGEPLTYQSTSLFKDTGEGVDYYLLLDVSASISKAQFDNIKNGVNQFIAAKGPKDKCILLTFGNESRVVLDGSETAEQAASVVNGLVNEDMETVLFQTIVQTAGMIDKAAQSEEKRRVIIAVTDGEDCVTGQATSGEAEKALTEKGIPLYAMAVDVGKEEYINSFGEFARKTGGTLNIFSQGESGEVLTAIRETIVNSFVAVFQNTSNVASNQREDFTVKFSEHQVTATREVIPTRWIPDTESPQVVSFEKQGENEIVITFSEPVLGADVQANYKAERDGEALSLGSVFYSEKDGYQAVLTFEKPLYTGAYTISFSNITDDSMEKNLLQEQGTFDLEGVKEEEPEKSFWEVWWWAILAGVLLVIVGLIVIVLVAIRKIKKNKGILYVDGKATLASNVDVKQHVSVKNLPQKNIRLMIKDKTNGKCELQVTINGSAMAGRSDDCDVYFDDLKMSRQHFALETDGMNVYITDLESKNGTYVNGVQIHQRRKLEKDDEITAGNIQARILW